jgi:hypothetical protein
MLSHRTAARARWYRSCHGATIGAMLIDGAMAEDSFAMNFAALL